MEAFLLEVADTTPRRYRVTTAMRMLVAGELIEQVEEMTISLHLRRSAENRQVLHLRVLENKQESNQELLQWSAIVNQALDDVLVTLDEQGKASRITINQAQVKKYELIKKLQQTYKGRKELKELPDLLHRYFRDPQQLLPHFNEQGWQSLFFHGLYGRHRLNIPKQDTKVLRNFFGPIDLPISLTRVFQAPNAPVTRYTLQTQGVVDKTQFDRKGFVRWLKDLYDAYNMKVSEQFEYEEVYQFDPTHFIQHAESFFSFQVENAYQCSLAKIVDQITPPHEPKVRSEWMLSNL